MSIEEKSMGRLPFREGCPIPGRDLILHSVGIESRSRFFHPFGEVIEMWKKGSRICRHRRRGGLGAPASLPLSQAPTGLLNAEEHGFSLERSLVWCLMVSVRPAPAQQITAKRSADLRVASQDSDGKHSSSPLRFVPFGFKWSREENGANYQRCVSTQYFRLRN